MLAFEILGPLVVRRDDGEIPISGARRRALVLRLLVTANELVPAGPLAEDLWEGSPPAGAAATLQSHISQLRKSLGPGRLHGRHGGYVLEVGPDELDVWRFEEESRQGRDALAAGDPGAAAGLLGSALGRWRGQVLADVSGTTWARPEQTRLEELHLAAIETWLEARLALGQHQVVVASAEAAVVDHPLREGIWGYLMLALYRSGRQSDALRAFQRVRKLLGEELGIEPSAPLVALDDAIVQQKPELGWSVTGAENEPWAFEKSGPPPGPQQDAPLLPTGTVTLLMTDIEGSTRLWETHPQEMGTALRRHDELIRSVVVDAGGHVFKTVGDAVWAVFPSANQALDAAVVSQRALQTEPWPEGAVLRVRMALHTGECEERDGDYFGPALNRTARLAAVAHGGQMIISRATADVVRDYLRDGVGLRHLGTHRLKDLGRPEEVFQLETEGLDAQFPPLRSLDDPDLLHNLPELVSSFVGREAEVAEVRTMVEESRLVTLAGAGGVGKTRLALHVGAELLDGSGDGVWIVELSAVRDPEQVTGAVANALGVKEQGGLLTHEILVTALAGRNILIVLDNCEHLIGACAKLAEAVVRGCPKVHLLATSREALGIDGERVFRVPSLRVPSEDAQELSDVAASGAVTLFVERAKSQATDFTLTEDAAPLVAAICRRLDGMPLAIELAAARLRSMSLSHLHDRLDQRFRLLTGGSRTALPRQQTLRAMVDWSYDLLNDFEQAVLRRLSVFVDGFDLEAAEAVCGFGDIEGFDVAILLGSVVDKSLVVAETHGSAVRYRMQETLRQYGVERLGEAADGDPGEADRLADTHSDYYLGLAEEAAPHMLGGSRRSWVRRLTTEDTNLRAAIAHAVATPEGADRVLGQFWSLRRYWGDAHQPGQILTLIDQALDRLGPDLAPGRRGQALYCKVLLLYWVDRRRIIETVSATLDLARVAGDRVLEAGALSHYCLFQDGTDPGRLDAGAQAVALAHEIGDSVLVGTMLYNYATALHLAEDPRTEAFYLEGLTVVEQSGDEVNALGLHCNYAGWLTDRGNLSDARPHLEVALELVGAEMSSASVVINLNLNEILLEEGQVQRAEAQLMDLMRLSRRIGSLGILPETVLVLARCATQGDECERAAILHGGADVLLSSLSRRWNPGQARKRATDIAVLRDLLGNDFERHYAAGLAMTHNDIIKLAIHRS